MKFTEMVAAAEANVRAQGARDADCETANQDLARVRMVELSALLAEHAEEIRALQASLRIDPGVVLLELNRDGRQLRLEVFFETEVWKLYFVSWTVSTASSADDGHGKAASAAETISLLAEMIGRHIAGARPTAARA
jgi:hypothetical protein